MEEINNALRDSGVFKNHLCDSVRQRPGLGNITKCVDDPGSVEIGCVGIHCCSLVSESKKVNYSN
jgi:hypothetical protein